MKAAYIEATGPAESIRFGDLPEPAPGPERVLVEVAAVTVDPIDTYIRSGAYPVDLPNPFVIGRDMVGTVVQAAHGFQAGDRVWCNNQGYQGRQGTFAQQVAVAPELLYRLPPGVDPQAAVAVFHSALTAITGLDKAGARAGETLFINGGSGNVGTAVLQLANAAGLRVAATAGSPEKADWLRENGAERVIDYHRESIAEALKAFAPGGLDLYWEATAGLDLDQVLDLVAPHARILLMAGLKRTCSFPAGKFYTKNCSLHGFTVTSALPHQLAAAAHQINGWLSKGVLRAHIHSVLPLSESAQAHRQVEAGVFGKIVLLPG